MQLLRTNSDPAITPAWIRWAARALLLALAAAHTTVAVFNQSMNEDGIAYLDLGDAWLRGDWDAVANTTWSPLYALILGIVINTVEPAAANEFPLVQLTNFGLFVIALICFEYFWRRLEANYRQPDATSSSAATLPGPLWWILGYSLFAWSSLNLIEIWAVTPDMTVAAIVYLASGLWVAAWRTSDPRRPAALGAGLGVGYLAKAVMFPLGIAFIIIAALLTARSWPTVRRLVPTIGVFLAVAGPLVIATSIAAGHVTFSDVGRFTYLKHVNAMPYPAFEDAAQQLGGSIAHGPRKIFTAPDVFEFAEPVAGTYPLGADPAYWTRGIEPIMTIEGQASAIASNLVRYFDLFARIQGGTLTAILLLGVSALAAGWRPQWRSAAFGLIMWAIVALGLYSLVRTEARYLAPFVVLLLAGLIAWIRIPESRTARQLVTTAGVLIAVWQWVNIGAVNLAEASKLVGFRPGLQDAEIRAHLDSGDGVPTADNLAVVAALRDAGLSPGDEVAFAGYSFSAYWARLARLRIVAEIRPADVPLLWSLSPGRLAELDATLRRIGVTSLIVEPRSTITQPTAPGWRQLDGTGYFLRNLHDTATDAVRWEGRLRLRGAAPD